VPRISDEQWGLIRKHFPEEHNPDHRLGGKPIPARKVLEAALWILNTGATGARWHRIPQCYPNYKTVHRRLQQWRENEAIPAVLTELANSLREDGAIDESECYIGATTASAKGGGDEIGPTGCGQGVKIMAIVDCHDLPLAVMTHVANHHEARSLQLTFGFYRSRRGQRI
jgi:transposase